MTFGQPPGCGLQCTSISEECGLQNCSTMYTVMYHVDDAKARQQYTSLLWQGLGRAFGAEGDLHTWFSLHMVCRCS